MLRLHAVSTFTQANAYPYPHVQCVCVCKSKDVCVVYAVTHTYLHTGDMSEFKNRSLTFYVDGVGRWMQSQKKHHNKLMQTSPKANCQKEDRAINQPTNKPGNHLFWNQT